MLVPAALLVVSALGCRCSASPNVSIGPRTFNERGSETWTIDGTDYTITRTYNIAFPEGAQFTVEWECGCPDRVATLDADSARELAAPLTRYAYESGAWERGHLAGAKPNRIGVEIVATSSSARRGYRTARDIAEIQADLEKATP